MDAMVGSDKTSVKTVSVEACASHLDEAREGFDHIVNLTSAYKLIKDDCFPGDECEKDAALDSLIEVIKLMAKENSVLMISLAEDTKNGGYD